MGSRGGKSVHSVCTMKVSVTRVDWRPRKQWMVHYRPQGAAGPQRRIFFRRRIEAEAEQRKIEGTLGSHGTTALAALGPEQVREYQEAKAAVNEAEFGVRSVQHETVTV